MGLLVLEEEVEEAETGRTSRYSDWNWIEKQINQQHKKRRQETGRREAMAESRQPFRKVLTRSAEGERGGEEEG